MELACKSWFLLQYMLANSIHQASTHISLTLDVVSAWRIGSLKTWIYGSIQNIVLYKKYYKLVQRYLN